MVSLPKFELFNQKMADTIIQGQEGQGGLPGFIGANVTEFGPGYLKAELEVRSELLTPIGVMHGGVMAGFVDHITGVVLYPMMEPGSWAATTEFKLNYLAPVKGGILEAESEVISLTRNTAVVRALVSNEDRLVCSAQGTLLIRAPKK